MPPKPTSLGLLLACIPFHSGAWFYLELARQLLTYALEASKVKRMVEFPEIHLKLEASVNKTLNSCFS